MRIAQVAPLTEAVPPKLYGGTERVVHWLTEELVALGHDVTLFASGDSQTSAKLDATWPKALRLDGIGPRSQRAAHGDAGTRTAKMRRRGIRLSALPSRLLSVLAVFAAADSVSHHAARQARPAGASAGIHDILIHPGDFDLERAAAPGAAGQLGSHHPPRPAGKVADAAAGDPWLIWRCSAGSRRKRASIARSKSPYDAASRSRSRQKSIAPIRTITMKSSAR